MKRSLVNSVLVLFISTASLQVLKAQTNELNVVTSAVPFLRISPDARAGGMGDVGIATNPDANSMFWNLAKTPFAKAKSGLSLTYTPWLKDLGLNDVYLASMAGYYKIDDQQAVSGSLRYFSLGNITFTDFSGNELNSFRPRELGFDVGYTRKLNDKLSIGVAGRYIYSNLIGGAAGTTNGTTYKAGTSVAADLSIYKDGSGKDGQGLSWGVVLSNLGTKIGYTNDAQGKDYIPANLGVGFAYTTIPDESNRITFAIDINKLLVPAPPIATGDFSTDSSNLSEYRNKSVFNSWFSSFGGGGGLKKLQVSLGAEYVYNEQFAVRAGYFYEDASQGNRKYFTFGAGLKYNVIGINLSYLVPSGNGVTRNPLSNTLRFGLTFDLDGESK
ncbi:MAG: type IX secretion system outer membrane channel protein PorV [Chitinophagaceae bacterium]